MNKRIFALICTLFVFIGLDLFSETVNYTDKVGPFENGYRKFDGFSFKSFSPSTDGIDKRVQAEVQYVIDTDKKAGNTGNYSIVGHSQGGLRVLAYASYLKKTNPEEYKRLQAVITVSGIDKGLKALDGGFPAVRGKIQSDVNVLYNGFVGTAEAVAPGISFWGGVYNCIAGILNWADVTDLFIIPNRTETTDLIVSFLPGQIKGYVQPAMNGVNPDSMAEIRDMFPQSTFLSEYVSATKRHDYKVQTGTRHGWETRSRKVWGIRVYYLAYYSYPVYTNYTAYEDIPKFDNDLPVGYIVGLNGNSLALLDQADVGITEADVRTLCSGMADTFNTAKDIHISRCHAVMGLFTGSPGYAVDCRKARDWMRNIDGQLNELKGAPENDGLVAKESQYYPRSFTDPNTGAVRYSHTNVLGGTNTGFVEFPQYNHANIFEKTNQDVFETIDRMLFESLGKRVR